MGGKEVLGFSWRVTWMRFTEGKNRSEYRYGRGNGKGPGMSSVHIVTGPYMGLGMSGPKTQWTTRIHTTTRI